MRRPRACEAIVRYLDLIGAGVKLESSAPGLIRIADRRVRTWNGSALPLRPDVITGKRVIPKGDPAANAPGDTGSVFRL